jgi:hypothetical protein
VPEDCDLPHSLAARLEMTASMCRCSVLVVADALWLDNGRSMITSSRMVMELDAFFDIFIFYIYVYACQTVDCALSFFFNFQGKIQ